MQWLKNLLGWLVNPLGSLPPERRRKVIRWTLHVVLVVATVVALGFLNHVEGLDRVLRTRFLGLYRVWLPLLFLLGYALYWLIRWLYWLLGPDGVTGEFDDIESAWRQARAALDEAGIGLSEAPVYLVLGRSSASLETVFAASRQPFQVRHEPREGEAPLHVYANRDAIFVTCEGAALLPVQADRLLRAITPPDPPPATQLDEYLETGELNTPVEAAQVTVNVQPVAAPGSVLLLGEPEPAPGDTPRRPREPLMKDPARVDLATKRLRQVCKTLARDRQPYCPVNGIVILMPLAATATPEDASETAAVMRHDLEVARGALQMDCPRFVVLCDGEQLPGFAEVVRHFPQDGGGPRWVLGQHYPLLPDVNTAEVPQLIESGLSWVGDTMLPLVISRLWRREGEPDVVDRASAVEGNILLYEFLDSCRDRLTLLGRLASRGVQLDGVPPLLSGCYLAGTGADAELEQGFLAGVLRRAIEQQNQVRWIADALADDRAYHRYAAVGYTLLAVFVVAIALILVAWW